MNGASLMRRRVLQTFFLAAAGILAWRSVDLMFLRKDFLQDRGDARSLRVVEIPAHRGVIRDRHGEPLAISTPVSSVWANPRRLLQARHQWPALAAVLGMKPDRLAAILEPRKRREFVYLKRHVPPPEAARVMALDIPGVALQREFRRYYPAGEMAAHVIGFTNVDDQGQEGLELTFDQRLRGEPGLKQVIKDGKGRVIEDVEGIRPMRRGEDLFLSIDRRLQYLAYRELQAAVSRHQARGGSLVLLDPRSGEVLALVNQPSFNPNNRSGLKSEYFRNRAVTDLLEPGSTIKPFTIAAALETGAWTPRSLIDTSPGSLAIGRHRISDSHNYGRITIADVIRKSSNVGAAKVALSLAPERLWDMYFAVGFGQIPGAGFPGEAAGRLADWRDWGEAEQATIAFGYGLSVSCLQLARAYAVFANDGRLPA
ncbi:MAG: penicillin-binding protein 2, partial [Gammaproteobacteria bacterium]